MEKRDVAFLNNYQNFGYLGHMASAVALYRAGVQAEDAASEVHILVDLVAPNKSLTPEEAQQRAREEGTSIRVQGTVIARLFAEYLSAIEDFGALLYAIRARKDGGVFYQYAKSREQVDEMFKLILSHDKFDLPATLDLPYPEYLVGKLSSEELESLAHDYDMIAEAVLEVADMYRTSSKDIDPHALGDATIPSNWEDILWIILDYKPAGKWSAPKDHRIYVEAFNKIKHRFLVIEQFPTFIKAIDNQDYLVYGHQLKTPEFAEAFLNSIAGVVTRQLELSAILVRLDKANVI